MPDDPDRSHDTDPLADTQTSDESPSASTANKKRVVHTGDVLGRYELAEDIGEGGMATVFRAKDRELRREVAVKVLFPHLARRPDVVRRFHREARAAAGLEHPNILRVYDVGGGEEEDPPYIVMELIRGNSLLFEIEKRGPMLAEIAACIGALLADALAVAHQAGIIHRDVKPANVMIASGGRVLLADFGVARLETEDSLVTKTGSVLGTPAYMSPEQASGDTATQKSDLYSLGATLYQLATGSLPYSGSPAKVLSQIAAGSMMSAVRRRAEVGPDLSRVIDRLMAVDPVQRPENAATIADELRKIAAGGGFGDPKDELTAYFADADKFTKDKLPKVVSALITTAERAIADEKLPRAMALADRASALAPQDPAVNELVAKVTEGGKATKRRRVLAMIGGAAVLAGGVTVGAMQLFGGEDARTRDASLLAQTGDADVSSADAIVATNTFDADTIAMLPDAGIVADAGSRVRADAGARTRDASTTIARADASASAPPADATQSVAAAVDAAVAPASGFIVIKTDLWCDVTIDGVPRGRNSTTPIKVDAGKHDVVCEQTGTGKKWSTMVEVVAGKTAVAQGSVLGTPSITFDVAAKIDGVGYVKGAVVKFKAGRHDLEIDGHAKKRFDLRQDCTIRATPEPGCF